MVAAAEVVVSETRDERGRWRERQIAVGQQGVGEERVGLVKAVGEQSTEGLGDLPDGERLMAAQWGREAGSSQRVEGTEGMRGEWCYIYGGGVVGVALRPF